MELALRKPSRSDRELIRRLPAKWEVRVHQKNMPAQEFWRRVIAEYTQAVFQETVIDNEDWKGPVFYFDHRNRPNPG